MNHAMRLAGQVDKAITRRIVFTVAALDRLSCPSGKRRVWVYDARQAALAMMVTETQAKSFYLYRKVNGRPQRLRLGGYRDISIEQARRLTAEMVGEIVRGVDPMARRRRNRERKRTFDDLFQWFLENEAKPSKRSWEDDEIRYNKHLKRGLGLKPAASITTADIIAFHRKLGRTNPTLANRVLALISVIYNRAKRRGEYSGDNPAIGVEKYPESSRSRFLLPEEMPRFFAAMNDEPNPLFRDFFQLALWTGARSGNIKSMRWDEISFDLKLWQIPPEKAKGKQGIAVPLTPQAMEILERRRKADPHGQWVLPSSGKSGHLEEPKKAWGALLNRAAIQDLRIHDLRRTLGSWMAAGGASLHVIGKTLGHRNESTTAVYARLQLDPVRSAVDRASAAMLEAGEG